jgi:tRNA(fMet)-specific endonuclease VapC
MAASIYLLDTNVLSDMMRQPTGLAAQRNMAITQERPETVVCTSVIVQCELLFGLRRRTHPRWATHYARVIDSLEVKPLDAGVVEHYAQLRAHLETAGTPIGPNDTLIAAHALAIGAVLVTADSDFRRVPGLRVENWLADGSNPKI